MTTPNNNVPSISPTTTYWLDQDENIISISNNWEDFAVENGSTCLGAEEVIGKPISKFISRDPTRMWFNTLLQLSKISQTPVEREYRCDSPEIKRFMKMKITPEKEGQFRVDHILLKVEEQPYQIFINPAQENSLKPINKRCSICGRIFENGSWEEPDQIGSEDRNSFQVIYTVCPDCRKTIPKGNF